MVKHLFYSIITFIISLSVIFIYLISKNKLNPEIVGPIGPVDENPKIGPIGPKGNNALITIGPIGPTGPTGPPALFNNFRLLNVNNIIIPNVKNLSRQIAKNIEFKNYYYIYPYEYDFSSGDNSFDNNKIKTKYYFYLNIFTKPNIGDYFVINTIGLKGLDFNISIYGGPNISNDNIIFKIFSKQGNNTRGNELNTLNDNIKPNNIYYFYYIGNILGSNDSNDSNDYNVLCKNVLSYEN